jgi:hypothetical protein
MIRSLIAVSFLAFSIDVACAQPTVFRDKQGNRIGSAEQQGTSTVFRDKQGNRTGSAEQQGATTVFRDKQGNRVGSAQRH